GETDLRSRRSDRGRVYGCHGASNRVAVARSLTPGGKVGHPRTCVTAVERSRARAGHDLSTPPDGPLVLRVRTAGGRRQEHIGQTVTLTAWTGRRRDHGGVTFLDLRDASGVTQVVVREDEAMPLRNEYVLKVVGTVWRGPEGNEN